MSRASSYETSLSDVLEYKYVTKSTDQFVCGVCSKPVIKGELFVLAFIRKQTSSGNREPVMCIAHVTDCAIFFDTEKARALIDALHPPLRFTGGYHVVSKAVADPISTERMLKERHTAAWDYVNILRTYPGLSFHVYSHWYANPSTPNVLPSFTLAIGAGVRVPIVKSGGGGSIITPRQFIAHMSYICTFDIHVVSVDKSYAFSVQNIEKIIVAKMEDVTSKLRFNNYASITYTGIDTNQLTAIIVVYCEPPEAETMKVYEQITVDSNVSFHDFQIGNRPSMNTLSFSKVRDRAQIAAQKDLLSIHTALQEINNENGKVIHLSSLQSTPVCLFASYWNPARSTLDVRCNVQEVTTGNEFYMWDKSERKALATKIITGPDTQMPLLLDVEMIQGGGNEEVKASGLTFTKKGTNILNYTYVKKK